LDPVRQGDVSLALGLRCNVPSGLRSGSPLPNPEGSQWLAGGWARHERHHRVNTPNPSTSRRDGGVPNLPRRIEPPLRPRAGSGLLSRPWPGVSLRLTPG